MNLNFEDFEDLLEEEDLYDLLPKEYSLDENENYDEDDFFECVMDEYESEEEISLTDDLEDEESIFDKYFENLY